MCKQYIMISSFINTILCFQYTLAQLELPGLENAADDSPLSGALVAFILVLLAGIVIIFRDGLITRRELKEINQTYANKQEEVRKEYVEKFEKLQNEYLKREDERNRQWSESEKQTLQVLNGVTSILELGEKMGQKDTKEILEKLKILEEKLNIAINQKNK